jgi:tetratricopeptide (TPR) repeat protein
VSDIVRRCDRLPLALAVVAARAAVDPEARLTDIAEELRHPAGALDALNVGDDLTDVRAVFSWSYRSLPASTRRVFQVLGLHPGPDLDVYAAANLAGLPLAATRWALADLVRCHLVAQRSAQRYGMHDLLRAYAAEVAHAEWTPSEIHAALDRLNRFYLHTVCQLRDLLFPRGASVTAPEEPVVPMRFRDKPSRHTWVDVERANLVAVVVHGAHHGFTDFAQLMGLCMWAYLYNAGYSTDCLTVSTAALDAARIDGDPKAEANALNHLAGALMTLGRYTETITYGERSLELARLAGDTAGEAKMLGNLAEVYSLVGHSAQAKEYAEAALRMKLRGGSPGTLGDARKNLARLCRQLGLLDEALAHVHAALDAYASTGAGPDRVEALNILGAILLQRGDHDQARQALYQSLTLARSNGHSDTQQCQALIGLGTLFRRQDELEAAAGHLADALSIARSAGDPALQADALTELGLLRHEQGRSAEGLGYVRDALTMATDIGNRRQEVLSRNALGELLRATGDLPAARHQFGVALEVATDIEDPYQQERARAGLRDQRPARDGAA